MNIGENKLGLSCAKLRLASLLTLILRGGGANMPTRFSNAYTSGTECRIDLKPGCKFELVRCLMVYKKKLTNLDHLRTLAGLV